LREQPCIAFKKKNVALQFKDSSAKSHKNLQKLCKFVSIKFPKKESVMEARYSLSTRRKKELEQKIKNAKETGNLHWYQRLNAMYVLFAMGVVQEQVALSTGVCVRTIQRWVVLLFVGGSRNLMPQRSPGRPGRLTKSQRQALKEAVIRGPEACGYPTGVWTAELVQDYIHKTYRVFYSHYYIPELLKNLGCSFIKPKRHYVLTDNEAVQHVLWIRKRFSQLVRRVKKVGGVLLFEDESGKDLQTGSVRTWAQKGNPPNKPNNPKKDSVKLMGVIEFFTGELCYRIHDPKKEKITNEVMASFLRYVLKKYPKQEVFMVWDNAPYHYGKHIKKLVESNSRLHLEYLPSKAPHLNPIEGLWKELKKARLHIRYLTDKNMLLSAIRSGMKLFQLESEKVLSLMTVWKNIVDSPGKALKGAFDFLMPDGYAHLYQNVFTGKLERLLTCL
jgi:transposase